MLIKLNKKINLVVKKKYIFVFIKNRMIIMQKYISLANSKDSSVFVTIFYVLLLLNKLGLFTFDKFFGW